MSGELCLASVFGDNMVLQRNMPLPIWGKAMPGEKISVSLASQSGSVISDSAGRWTVKLPALPAGGPFELMVKGQTTLTLSNVMIGEVWLCSGQSNMAMTVPESINGDKEVSQADWPAIRLLQVPRSIAKDPQTGFKASWRVCDRNTVRQFSAVGYFFGRDIHKTLGVPVGLIDASWGGTFIEAWTSMDALRSRADMQAILKQYDLAYKNYPAAMADYQAKCKEWEKASYWEDPGNKGEPMGWAKADFGDSDWKTMPTPGIWEIHGLNIDGSVWFRKEVQIDSAWAGKELALNLGAVDDYDTTYFNGVKVGAIGIETPNPYFALRQYRVAGSLVKAGRNVIAVRVFDRFGGGGLIGPAEQMNLGLAEGDGGTISLTGDWKYKIELALEPKLSVPPPTSPPRDDDANTLSVLYNGMIHPLIPFALGGVIWYQGESNAAKAYQYRQLFPLMINDWRRRWGYDMPFLFVELASYMAPQNMPVERQTWPELREAQQMTLSLPKTGMATAVDIGDAGNIHPHNKQEVGRRLALSAMAVAFGKELVHSGPQYQSSLIEGNKVRIRFGHIGSGLTAKDGQLKGFAIAGEDRKWVWAEAKIDGQTVLVWSDNVPKPAAVRYSWADNPIGNLYNKEGLPALSFRTDEWPGLTEQP
ncbi:MAG: 9-O-acetylesterase [Planctomycetes bacterium]|nr:9-O-acetylesterase [Planctomycetota bacterium]